MKFPNRNSFVVGFGTATLIVALFIVWQNCQFMGGHSEDSPNGEFSLSITAPLDPRRGGTYTIKLVRNANGNILRTIALQLPASESTVSVRGNGASIVWSADSVYANVRIAGNDSLRVWVP